MKHDDPKLTHFALEELDAAEREAVEALLREDAGAAQEVSAMRELAAQLRTELKAEAPLALAPQQLASVHRAEEEKRKVIRFERRQRRVWLTGSIAASLVAAAGAYYMMQEEGRRRDALVHQGILAPEVAAPKGTPRIQLDATEAAKTPQGQLTATGGTLEGPTLNLQEVYPAEQPASSRLAKEVQPASPSEPQDATRGTTSEKLKAEQRTVAAAPVPPPPPAPMQSASTATSQKPFALAWDRPVRPLAGGQGSAKPDSAAKRARATNEVLTRNSFANGEAMPGVSSTLQPSLAQQEPSNTEAYAEIRDNPFLEAKENPLSTFSIDVDTASYANVRRLLQSGQRPPAGTVRIEELVNYFPYAYPQPTGDAPCSVTMEVAGCPWAPEHRLLRVGLKAKEVAANERPAANLVFLLDVSGSMEAPNKLPLLKQAMGMLVRQLGPNDRVSMVVYAGASGVVLEPTADHDRILAALENLRAGGSTNGAAGIQAAYELAQRSFQKGQANRVILCTDGDFNVGTSHESDLAQLITEKAKSGVFLTVLGFGYGNLKDATMEKLADKGNGNYGYIDTPAEARKLLVEQMNGTLVTAAKDVKVQVEFNPARVASYRLIGYENRLLAKEDFNDDTKDAGEMGAGHTVTALYEVVPVGKGGPAIPPVDSLKYAQAPAPTAVAEAKGGSDELLTLKLRWKAPEGDKSAKQEYPLVDAGQGWERSTADFRWAAAVAGFGMLLRDSPHKGQLAWSQVRELAQEGLGKQPDEYRREFMGLVEQAARLLPGSAMLPPTHRIPPTDVKR